MTSSYPSHRFTGVLKIVLVLLLASGLARAEETVGDLIAGVRAAESPNERTQAFYHMSDALDRGRVTLSEDGAAALAGLLLEVVLDPKSQHERLAAARMMEKNAHPLMADPLAEYLAEYPEDPRQLRRTIGMVMSRLHDARVLDPLVTTLGADEVTTVIFAIERLVELGDPQAIDHLKTLLADTTLTARYAEGLVARRRQWGNDTSPEQAQNSGRRDADKARTAAEIALRQLNLLNDHQVMCGFDLEESAMAVLAERGFVIPPHPMNEMYELYDEEYPFVTTDFVYHTAMILVRAGFDELEKGLLVDLVGQFSLALAQASLAQADSLRDRSDGSLARRNAEFFAVPAILCGTATTASLQMDQASLAVVTAELERIAAAATVEPSALLGVVEDYTQYRPRGRFSGEEAAGGYFQAVTWLARGGFDAQDKEATRRALLVTAAVAAEPRLAAGWRKIDEVYSRLVGEPDDPTVDDYLELASKLSGRQGLAAVQAVLGDGDLETAFDLGAAAMPPPRIHTGTDADRVGALGLRILGQRYSPDAHLFQMLMEDGVWPPSGLHVLAGLMGSERAARHLGEKVMLPPGMEKKRGPSLMDGYLDCYEPVLNNDDRLPDLFRTAAWQDKQLNSALGAWAETRHATAPYLKAAHIYAGCSAMTDRLHGFVEPYPDFFARLAGRMTDLHHLFERLELYDFVARDQEDLAVRLEEEFGPPNQHGHRPGLSSEDYRECYRKSLQKYRIDAARLPEFIKILERLAVLAVKCRDGVAQDPDDGLFLKSLGSRLRRLSFNHSSSNVAEESMARVIDVATEYYSGEVLEAGVGQALPIYVAVPDGDRRIVCRGAVYSYYEFVVPVAGRLDDSSWSCLASRLVGPGQGPWLETRFDLLHRALLDNSEVSELKFVDEEGLGRYLSNRAPWAPNVDRHFGVDFWVGARASTPDIDILLNLATGDDTAGSVLLFATEELFRIQGQVPAARDFFRQTVNRVLAMPESKRPTLSQADALRLYLAVQVLASTGDPEDLARLEELSAWIDTWPEDKWKLNRRIPCLKAALKPIPSTGGHHQFSIDVK